MSRFLKRTCLFLSIPVVIFFTLFIFLQSSNSDLLYKYISDKQVSSLIMGDSHTVIAVDGTLLKSCKNLSLEGENYVFTYAKLKAILGKISSVKNVFLGVGFHNISAYCDTRYDKGTEFLYSRDFSFVPFYDKMLMINKYRSVFATAFPYIIRSGFANLYGQEKDYSFLKKSYNGISSRPLDTAIVRKRIKVQFPGTSNFSDMQIYYLKKIVTLCREHSVNIYFLTTPIHKLYFENIPLAYKEKYDSIVRSSNVPVIDFKELNLPDSCFWADGDHVNASGAVLTTKFLSKYMN